jgi:hypothetical protein
MNCIAVCKNEKHPLYVLFIFLSNHSNYKMGGTLGKRVMAISYYRIMVMK